MLNNFKIRQGHSTELFDEFGKVKNNVVLELGTWYLCVDTACVYVCIQEGEDLILKRINGESFDNKIIEIDERLDQIEKNSLGYIKIYSEGELPTNFDDPNFNPKDIYYIEVDTEKHYINTYIFDAEALCYMCSRSSVGGTQIEGDLNLDEMIEIIHGGTSNI